MGTDRHREGTDASSVAGRLRWMRLAGFCFRVDWGRQMKIGFARSRARYVRLPPDGPAKPFGWSCYAFLDACGYRLGLGLVGPLRANGWSWSDPLRYYYAQTQAGVDPWFVRVLWLQFQLQDRRRKHDSTR